MLEFYYLLTTDDDINKIPKKTDDEEELVWISIEDIENQNIKPNFIKNKIHEILNSDSILHPERPCGRLTNPG